MSYNPNPENKKTKRVRIALCVLFLLNISCLSLPFIGLQTADSYQVMTAFNLMYFLSTGDGQFMQLGGFCLLFLLLPLAGFCTAAFDKHRNIKSGVGLAVSVVGICAILFLGANSLSIGAIFALLLYLATAFCSVIMFMANLSVNN